MRDRFQECFKRPVAILGGGVSGQAVAGYLGGKEISFSIYGDDREGFNENAAKHHDLVVYSPGFSQDHPWLRLAREKCQLVVGELDFGAVFWKGAIVAITGTNGKTTLTHLISKAFNHKGDKAFICGNIGVPLTSIVEYSDENAYAICEVSSFQAEDLQFFEPDQAIWTNFYEDHLDRHGNLKEYYKAKLNLLKKTKKKDKIFAGESVLDAGSAYGFGMCGIRGSSYDPLFKSDSLVPHKFNNYPQIENFLLARAFWERNGYDDEYLFKAAEEFSFAEHRMEKVTSLGKIDFYNDSKATNFSATLGALKGFIEDVIWIGGGFSKGGNIEVFAKELSRYIKRAFLIGDTAEEMRYFLNKEEVNAIVCGGVEDSVKSAWAYAKDKYKDKKAIILFSPGFASFDLFKNYEERGFSFKKVVFGIEKEEKDL